MSHGLMTHVPGYWVSGPQSHRFPGPRGPGPGSQGPRSQGPGSQDLRIPGPGSQVLILDYAFKEGNSKKCN